METSNLFKKYNIISIKILDDSRYLVEYITGIHHCLTKLSTPTIYPDLNDYIIYLYKMNDRNKKLLKLKDLINR